MTRKQTLGCAAALACSLLVWPTGARANVGSEPSTDPPAPEATPVVAMDPQAQGHFDQGLTAFQVKDYEAAIEQFRTGYEIDPRPELLFAWAQSERLSGDCPSAIKLLERFLAADPSKAQADLAQDNLEKCKRALDDSGSLDGEPGTSVSPDPKPAPPSLKKTEPDSTGNSSRPAGSRRAEDKPVARDITGGVLLGTGVAATGAGIGIVVVASRNHKGATGASDYDNFAQKIKKANTQRIGGGVLLGTGIALIAAAGLRYGLLIRTKRQIAAAPVATPNMAGFMLSGRF